MQGPQKRSSATDAALVSVLLINSLAVAYGFYQLRLISDTFQWSVAPALAVTAANRLEASTSPSQPTADIFWSFSCPACQRSCHRLRQNGVRRRSALAVPLHHSRTAA